MSTVQLNCTDCRRSWDLEPKVVIERFEITTVYKTTGIYRAAVCHRCGGLLEPYLKEVDGSDL